MIMYYYVDSNGNQVGPVDESGLKSAKVTKETLVWREGMNAWMPAGSVNELYSLFAVMPPEIVVGRPIPLQATVATQRPNTYMWLAICSTILCCLPAGIVSIVYASKVDSAWSSGDINEANKNSKNALTWGIVSVVVGLCLQLMIFFVALMSN